MPTNATPQGDQRLTHDSGRDVDIDYLGELGVLYHHCPEVAEVNSIAQEREYQNRDEITISPAAMGDIYEDKVRSFFHEHLHEDEEIRYIRDGAGYFDVRSKGDEWVRIRLEKDDMIILPAGIYHRFTTDENNVSIICGRGSRARRRADFVRSISRPCGCSKTSRNGPR